ncbi:hypothetical protein ACFLSZ_06940 [Candidatus Bipolaricaulota bacterium]
MLQIAIQSFVRAEVIIGTVLTILLVSGRSDPKSIAFALGGLGVFFLLQSTIPLSTRRSAPPQKTVEHGKAEATAVGQHAILQPPCSKKPFHRREYVIRTLLVSLVVIATACLIYWVAPPLVI